MKAASAIAVACLLTTAADGYSKIGDLKAACDEGNPYIVTIAMPDLITGYNAHPERPVAGLVAFRDTPRDSPHALLADPRTIGAI